MAYQATHQAQPAEAVTLIETAPAGIRGHETPALVAELSIKQADAFATLRDNRAPQPYLYWITSAEITAYAGQCLLPLGDTGQATPLLGDGIALLDESFPRNRQVYLTHLADALVRPGARKHSRPAGMSMPAVGGAGVVM